MNSPTIKNDLNVFKRIWNFVYHFLNGLYSGIPVCCIYHFCKLDFKYLTPTGFLSSWMYGDVPTPDNNGNIHGPYNAANYCRCHKCRDENHKKRCKNNGNIFGRYLSPFYHHRDVRLKHDGDGIKLVEFRILPPSLWEYKKNENGEIIFRRQREEILWASYES